MRRRDFISLVGGTLAASPLQVRAQQSERMRRIGVLMGYAESDVGAKGRLDRFVQRLAELGWVDGRNLAIDVRWAAGNPTQTREFAKELVELQPEIIVANSTPVTAALQRETRSIPIIFIGVSDPIGPGFVKSLPRPGGNITGFTNLEETMGGKWLELLREIAPSISQASMLFNPETANAGASGGIYLKSIETAARVTGTELIVSAVHDPAGIDEVFAAMAQGSGGGVLVMPNAFTIAHQERIVAQAERYRVPTIYPVAAFVTAGGLLSYGVDGSDLFRRAASYADRILKGANPADLPVQQPVKFELVINKKTAKALGLTIPPDLLVVADEVIE
jgi:putative tryptophan/tyrosine transport system substrate-binding protein